MITPLKGEESSTKKNWLSFRHFPNGEGGGEAEEVLSLSMSKVTSRVSKTGSGRVETHSKSFEEVLF